MQPSEAEKDCGIMKNSGISENVQTLMRKSVCAMLCLLLKPDNSHEYLL